MELRKNEEDGREMQRRMAASNAVSQLTEEGRRSPLPAPDVALPLSIHAFYLYDPKLLGMGKGNGRKGRKFFGC